MGREKLDVVEKAPLGPLVACVRFQLNWDLGDTLLLEAYLSVWAKR